MRIVFVSFARSDWGIGLGSAEADRRIIDAGFGFVVVLLDGAFGGFCVCGFAGRFFFGTKRSQDKREGYKEFGELTGGILLGRNAKC